MPRLQQFVNGIRERAIAHNGSYVPYSQMYEPTNTLIKSMGASKDGICLALSAKWMVEHAKGGSLWNWLCTPGTTNVKQSAIANLMINFHDSVVSSGSTANASMSDVSGLRGFAHQDVFLDRYMGLSGLKRRAITQDLVTGWQQASAGSVRVGQQLAARLSPKWMNTQSGTYVHIGTLGKGGHSTCAFVGSSDISFFDPNFGEFYFGKQSDFRNFFNDFWKMSGYLNSFNTFKLDAFAMAA